MTEAAILKLLDIGLTALSVGIERQAILEKVATMQQAGATPEQIAEGLAKMRDDAIEAAQKTIE